MSVSRQSVVTSVKLFNTGKVLGLGVAGKQGFAVTKDQRFRVWGFSDFGLGALGARYLSSE